LRKKDLDAIALLLDLISFFNESDDFFSRLAGSEFVAEGFTLDMSEDGFHRIEMLAGVFRIRQDKHHYVNGLTIEGIEVNTFGAAPDGSDRSLDPLDSGVGKSYTVANPRGSLGLSGQERSSNILNAVGVNGSGLG